MGVYFLQQKFPFMTNLSLFIQMLFSFSSFHVYVFIWIFYITKAAKSKREKKIKHIGLQICAKKRSHLSVHLHRNTSKCCWRQIFFFEKPIKIRIFHLDCCFVSNFSSNLLFVSGTSVDQSNGCNDITCHAIGVATAVQFQRSRLFYISLKLLFVFYRKSWCYYVADNHFIQLAADSLLPAPFLHSAVLLCFRFGKTTANSRMVFVWMRFFFLLHF